MLNEYLHLHRKFCSYIHTNILPQNLLNLVSEFVLNLRLGNWKHVGLPILPAAAPKHFTQL